VSEGVGGRMKTDWAPCGLRRQIKPPKKEGGAPLREMTRGAFATPGNGWGRPFGRDRAFQASRTWRPTFSGSPACIDMRFRTPTSEDPVHSRQVMDGHRCVARSAQRSVASPCPKREYRPFHPCLRGPIGAAEVMGALASRGRASSHCPSDCFFQARPRLSRAMTRTSVEICCCFGEHCIK
jgi:hypothetical protein